MSAIGDETTLRPKIAAYLERDAEPLGERLGGLPCAQQRAGDDASDALAGEQRCGLPSLLHAVVSERRVVRAFGVAFVGPAVTDQDDLQARVGLARWKPSNGGGALS